MLSFIRPVPGAIISGFGVPRDGGARSHEGIDFQASSGTQIVAAAAGTVTHAGWLNGNAGNAVKLDHSNGISTRYFHCSRVLVNVGQFVNQGQVIALVGATGNASGPHLHYEQLVNGQAVNPQFGASVFEIPSGQTAALIALGVLAVVLLIVRR